MAGVAATILVVDDDAAFRQTVRELIESQGYRVEDAATGGAALASSRRGGLALVVADIVMPDVEGLELLRILRQEQPALPVIVVTGAELRGTRAGALEAMARRLGAREVFRKPLELPVFTEAVRRLMTESAP